MGEGEGIRGLLECGT